MCRGSRTGYWCVNINNTQRKWMAEERKKEFIREQRRANNNNNSEKWCKRYFYTWRIKRKCFALHVWAGFVMIYYGTAAATSAVHTLWRNSDIWNAATPIAVYNIHTHTHSSTHISSSTTTSTHEWGQQQDPIIKTQSLWPRYWCWWCI